MKMRSFALMALGMMFSAAMFMVPASAIQIDDGWGNTFTASAIDREMGAVQDLMVFKDFVAVKSARMPDASSLDPRNSDEPMIKPIYAASMATNGPSLAGYHCRC